MNNNEALAYIDRLWNKYGALYSVEKNAKHEEEAALMQKYFEALGVAKEAITKQEKLDGAMEQRKDRNGENMKKTVEISIDLYPDDIAEYITEGNDSEQAEVIYLLAHKYYNDPHGFVAEVKHTRDYIKDCYNHDVQRNIKRMIKDMYEVFWEGEDGNVD